MIKVGLHASCSVRSGRLAMLADARKVTPDSPCKEIVSSLVVALKTS